MDDLLIVREATLEDASVIAEISEIAQVPGDVLRSAAEIRAQIEGFSERERYFLLERDGFAVGWGLIKRYSPRGGYRFCAETWVYVRPSEMRKGYGSRLKRTLIDQCRAFGYHHLIARIFSANTACLSFYQRFKYEIVGVQEEIGFFENQWQDLTILQLVDY